MLQAGGRAETAVQRWTSAARAQAYSLNREGSDENHAIAGRLQGLVRAHLARNCTTFANPLSKKPLNLHHLRSKERASAATQREGKPFNLNFKEPRAVSNRQALHFVFRFLAKRAN